MNMVLYVYMQKLHDCTGVRLRRPIALSPQVVSPHRCYVAPTLKLFCPNRIDQSKLGSLKRDLMVFKVSKSLTRFVGYYYGKNQDSLQAAMDTCGLQTQVFHLPETKVGNLSVFAGDVIEETQCY